LACYDIKRMNTDSHSPIDLQAIARQEMLREGFHTDFPQAVLDEVMAMNESAVSGPLDPAIRDLRMLLWSSIDNQESRDLDQVEVAERLPDGHILVRIGIADVDAFVPIGSATDRFAADNSVSVYTGVATFPMLPERLSTELTSLLPGVDRLAIVIELLIAASGPARTRAIYRALLRNQAKLEYQAIGRWLDGESSLPREVAEIAGLEEQLRLQNEATERLLRLRHQQGALEFETTEARPVVSNGEVLNLKVQRKSRSQTLIENFMITSNVAMASYLEERGCPAIRRVARKPKRWPRIVEIAGSLGEALPEEADSAALAAFLARRKAIDPAHYPDLSLAVVKLLGAGEYVVVPPGSSDEGHFGLAVQDYTHSTAPNRRYPDLLTQRLLKASLSGSPVPYSFAQLEGLAERCEERQSAARKVERFMRKVIAAELLSDSIGQVFEAMVTGITGKGTFVRLLDPPAEGKVVRGEGGLDVGDNIKVRLLATEPDRGFIDFEQITR
jgi:VacB/RNase II family 3'-5' exoribonuclease